MGNGRALGEQVWDFMEKAKNKIIKNTHTKTNDKLVKNT